MKDGIFNVSELNNYIKSLFDDDPTLNFVKLEGELSDVKVYPSGHMYFNIIDENSSISGVMFNYALKSIKFTPKNGDQIIVSGSVSTYPKTGKYQVYVNKMELSGEGAKLLKLLELKKKLEAEGLFDISHKREINLYPNKLGIITAKGSAALSDLLTNISRRYPLVDIYVFYAQVQGNGAEESILKAMNEAYSYPLDTLIIGRGGGSSEDLWAFNDERIARLAYASPMPIISAVGHEIDFTLLDFVADKRASTPTGAAELATVDKREIYELLDISNSKITNAILNRISSYKEKLFYLKNRPFFINPSSIYKDELNELNILKENLKNVMKLYLTNKNNSLITLKEKLTLVNPKNILSRGFSMLKDKKGKVIKDINEVKIGEEITTILKDGTVYSNVIKKEKNI